MHRLQHRVLNRILAAAREASGNRPGEPVACVSYSKYSDGEPKVTRIRLAEDPLAPDVLAACLRFLESKGLLSLRATVHPGERGVHYDYLTTKAGLEAAPLEEVETGPDGELVHVAIGYSVGVEKDPEHKLSSVNIPGVTNGVAA
jgi:hypothetical protein